MFRFIRLTALVMTAAIAAMVMVRQAHFAAAEPTETRPVPTNPPAFAHTAERATPIFRADQPHTAPAKASRREPAISIRDLRPTPATAPPREPLSPFSSTVSHAVPGRAAGVTLGKPYLTPHPAAWIDLDLSGAIADPDFPVRVTALAQDVVDKTGSSPEVPVKADASGETRLAADGPSESQSEVASRQRDWANAVAESDFRFRQLYGGHVWMMHHIESHHLAAGNLPEKP